MVKEITVLGSTGSIGTQTLEICRRYGISINALCAHSNIRLLEQQVREFHPCKVAVADEARARELKVTLQDHPVKVLGGEEAVRELAADPHPGEMLVNALVGMAGLLPTLAAIEAGKDIALANKETLVAGGELVKAAAKEKGCIIFPVDSEHSAIFQCLMGHNSRRYLNKIILTASGGPFFGKKKDELENVTAELALKHPNWSMGPKITVDSATLMNKGLEVIEAVHLFDVRPDQIEVVVHRESIIHSAVEFQDGSVIAQMGEPDMKIPIQLALTYPERKETGVKPLSLTAHKTLSFGEPDMETFTALAICIQAIQAGGLAPCIANGANEAAVERFLRGEISFLRIAELVAEAVQTLYHEGEEAALSNILDADKQSREFVHSTTS